MNYTYYTKGTCSKQIDLEINGDVITCLLYTSDAADE